MHEFIQHNADRVERLAGREHRLVDLGADRLDLLAEALDHLLVFDVAQEHVVLGVERPPSGVAADAAGF